MKNKDRSVLRPWSQASALVCAAFLSVHSFGADSSTCQRACTQRTSSSPNSVTVSVIDPKSFGSLEMDENARIEVVLTNKNPFRYEYSLKVETKSTERDILKEAFALLGFPEFEKANTDAAVAKSVTATAPAVQVMESAIARYRGAPAPAACTQRLQGFENALQNAVTARDRELAVAKTAVATLNEEKKKYTSFEDAVRQSNPETAACPDLCGQAVDASEALKSLSTPTGLTKPLDEISKLQGAIGTISTQVAVQLTAAEVAQCSAQITALDLRAKSFVEQTTTLAAAYITLAKELNDQKANYVKARASIEQILSNPDSFSSIEYIPAQSEPVVHEITLIRKDRLPPNSVTSVPLGRINAGHPIFSISMGPGLSFIDQNTYGRQSGLIPDGSGGETVGSVIAVTEKSGESLAFVAQINARLGTWKQAKAAFHATFGASVGDGVGDTDIGLFLGPSMSFMRERVFITLAYHYQETKDLAPSFKVGQPIPAEIEGDPPTTTHRESGLLFTLTYKVR